MINDYKNNIVDNSVFTCFFLFLCRYLDAIERAVSNGDCLLLENIMENVDPVLDSLLGRLTIKKGRYIKIGDKEVEYHPKFRMILQTKLANPHYKPEMQAQATLINFTVTRDGLEDQLLAQRSERHTFGLASR